jgi:hypothetical protein
MECCTYIAFLIEKLTISSTECLVIKKLDLDMDPDVPIRLDPDPDSVKMDPQLLGQIIRYPRMFLCYIGTFISHFISWQCYQTGMIFPYQYPMVPSNIVK